MRQLTTLRALLTRQEGQNHSIRVRLLLATRRMQTNNLYCKNGRLLILKTIRRRRVTTNIAICSRGKRVNETRAKNINRRHTSQISRNIKRRTKLSRHSLITKVSTTNLLLNRLHYSLLKGLILHLFSKLSRQTFRTRAVITKISSRATNLNIFHSRINMIVGTRRSSLLYNFKLYLLPLIRDIPVTRTRMMTLTLKTNSRCRTSLNLLKRLRTTVNLQLKNKLTLRIGRNKNRRQQTCRLIRSIVRVFKIIILLRNYGNLLSLQVRNKYFKRVLFILFKRKSVPRFGFVTLVTSHE